MPYPLLTSDRPIVMTNGLNKPDSHVVMPLSPWHILLVTKSEHMTQELRKLAVSGKLPSVMNDFVARQARKYVYGTDERQLRFVKNRLGTKAQNTPFE